MSLEDDFLHGVEVHAPGRIAAALAGGLDPNVAFAGFTPLQWQIRMYTRSPRFPECVRVLLEAGARVEDGLLAAMLLDDAARIRELVLRDPGRLHARVDLESAFTPLIGATLLHVAAEFGLERAARELLELGADPEARAAVDGHGWDGQTPVFHTVNAPHNHGQPVLRLLLRHGARSDVHLAGITWGRGFEWETALFDVTPLSYAQAGLLPQLHRAEADVYDNLRLLCGAAARDHPALSNVPNRYVARSRRSDA